MKRRTFLTRASGAGLTAVSGGAASGLYMPAAFGQSPTMEKEEVRIAYPPHIGAGPLLVARSRGFAEDIGLKLRLSSYNSLPEVVEQLATDELDGAILPASFPLFDVFRLEGFSREQLLCLFMTGMNGGGFTVNPRTYDDMVDIDRDAMAAARPTSARAMRLLIDQRRAQKKSLLRLGVPNENGVEDFMLRYWLGVSGIHPDNEVEIVAMPSPLLVASLQAQAISGFWAPEPFNSFAISAGFGRTLVTNHEVWANAPSYSFCVTVGWSERFPNTQREIVRMLSRAAKWMDSADNRPAAARTVGGPSNLNVPEEIMYASMRSQFRYIRELDPEPFPDFHVFHRYVANFPWHSDALWFLAQMLRWGKLVKPFDLRRVAQSVYRPDIFRDAVAALTEPLPRQNYKTEGSHFGAYIFEDATAPFVMGSDGFIDGNQFSPADITGYLNQFNINSLNVDLDKLREING